MYRYSVDNAVTYTSEDFVLFRESPFACWMERLTLENPDHGIPPDVGSHPPENTMERQDDIAETLRAEERDVALIDWDDEEPARRSATLDAMRRGVDFVVNGQLALGPLSGSANLLMRTSGYSELGSYLYIPCDTQARTSLHSGFRLCFLADLLHSLQGQLPPQMLIIRSGADVMPLQSEDRIYHYRAVKQRFMEAMRTFRKHRMPDPAESSHFGRWSDCANEVLKQRALRVEREEGDLYDQGDQAFELPGQFEVPVQKVAGDAHSTQETPQTAGMAPPAATGTLAEQARQIAPDAYQVEPREVRGVSARTTFHRGREQRHAPASNDVAETPVPAPQVSLAAELEAEPQHAQQLAPQNIDSDSLHGKPASDTTVEAAGVDPDTAPHSTGRSDAALQNLEFIGSRQGVSSTGPATWSRPDQRAYDVAMPQSGFDVAPADIPAPGKAVPGSGLRGEDTEGPLAELANQQQSGQLPQETSSLEEPAGDGLAVEHCAAAQEPESVELAPPPPNLGVVFNPEPAYQAPEPSAARPHPLDSVGFNIGESSMVDRDDASIATPAPSTSVDFQFFPPEERDHAKTGQPDMDRRPFGQATDVRDKPERESPRPFNDSLITNTEYED